MNVYDCNTVEGIRAQLERDGLDGLHAIGAARRDRRDRNATDLSQFLIAGRFWLDRCGNVLHAKIEHRYKPVEWMADSLPLVVPLDALMFIDGINVSGAFAGIPRSSDKCSVCDVGWTLANCHDSVYVESKPLLLRHSRCHRLERERKQREQYQAIVAGAGLFFAIDPIPNGYSDDGLDWALIRTPLGDIKMGWRKRVIALDWANVVETLEEMRRPAKRDFDDWKAREAFAAHFTGQALFPNEDVTRWETGIHAWSTLRAGTYLQVVYAHAKALDPRRVL